MDGLCLVQKEVLWLRVRLHTVICEDKDKYLECGYGLCCFSKLEVVDSSPITVTSLVLSSQVSSTGMTSLLLTGL